MVKWNISVKDLKTVHLISVRAAKATGRNLIDIEMDITACHLNGTKLNLTKLAAFKDFNFFHDVNGIANHINRSTGKLTNYFLPRCSRGE